MSANRLDQLIATWDARIRKAFLDAIQGIRDEAELGKLADRIAAGDVDGALKAVGVDADRFTALDAAMLGAFGAGGAYAAKNLPALRDAAGYLVRVVFNIRNPRAERWIAEHSSKLIVEITADQRAVVRDTLRQGLQEGRNPRSVALDLVGRINPATKKREGGAIGLTASQEEWTRRYRQELIELKPAALTRALRDKRFDKTVALAIRDGKPINAERIDAMVRNYRNRALRYRGETIGRTEAMRTLHAAQDEAFRQGLDKGGYTEADVIRVWRSVQDDRVRDTHSELHGDTVRGLSEPFVSSSGAKMLYPGDTSLGAPAQEIINCRCWAQYKIDFLRGIK